MRYVYPQLSDMDLFFVRLGGAGLGNLLLIYAKALCYAEKYHAQLIWPTWPSIKIGPWIRKERDKRFYHDIFQNNTNYIDGLNKLRCLTTKKRISEECLDQWLQEDEAVLVVHRYEMNFEPLIPFRKTIVDHLIHNLCSKNRKAVAACFDGITIHVRLGDFAKADVKRAADGADNIRMPIEWFVLILRLIRKAAQRDVEAYVFSDGSDDELKLLLNEANVHRVSYGTSIADIIGLSRGKMMIASGSSFSMWARFIGNVPVIGFKNQLRQNLTDHLLETEKDMDAEFTEHEIEYIYRLFNK